MTTILADFKVGAIVSDTMLKDQDDNIWHEPKIFTLQKQRMIISGSGSCKNEDMIIGWFRKNGLSSDDEWPPKVPDAQTDYLIMSHKGLYLFNDDYWSPKRIPSGLCAAGSGTAAVRAAYEALGARTLENMKKAVKIACKFSLNSRLPIQVKRLPPKTESKKGRTCLKTSNQ